MHKAERLLSGIWFGFDEMMLYFRLDRGITVEFDRFKEYCFEIEFIDSSQLSFLICPSVGRSLINGQQTDRIKYAAIEILEIAIPIEILPKTDRNQYLARIIIKEDGRQLESWPPAEALMIELPSPSEIPWAV